jgi:hypothetical protein
MGPAVAVKKGLVVAVKCVGGEVPFLLSLE